MKSKEVHFYSAYLRKGGANLACDSLYTELKSNIKNINFSRSTFNEQINFKYKLNRISGKLISSISYQSQFYRPYTEKYLKKDFNNFSIVHAHWLNNIPLNSIPKCESLIITAHDQWFFNYGWAWDPISLNSPTKKLELGINNFSKFLKISKKPLTYISDNYPLEKIITPSSWLRNYILYKTNLPKDKIVVIKNIINTNYFNFNNKIYKKFREDTNHAVIVTSTAYWQEWRKGGELLMKLFRKLLEVYKGNIEFKIIGKINIDTDIKNNATLYGNLQNKSKIASILNSSNCMVMPSRLENLTQTICEGLLCGLPTVAFDVGGNKEIISNETFGSLVEYPHIERFIIPITELVEKDNQISRKARAEEAKLKFSNSSIIKKHLEVYKDYL